MAFYRKKPVVIEAVRFDGILYGKEGAYSVLFDTVEDLPKWLKNALMDKLIVPSVVVESMLVVSSAEGWMEAQPGDWIIRGVKGELYPCKPDIFALTYEPAPQPEDDVTGVAI